MDGTIGLCQKPTAWRLGKGFMSKSVSPSAVESEHDEHLLRHRDNFSVYEMLHTPAGGSKKDSGAPSQGMGPSVDTTTQLCSTRVIGARAKTGL